MDTGYIHSQVEAVCSREEGQEECVHMPPESAQKDEEHVAAESECRAGRRGCKPQREELRGQLLPSPS